MVLLKLAASVIDAMEAGRRFQSELVVGTNELK